MSIVESTEHIEALTLLLTRSDPSQKNQPRQKDASKHCCASSKMAFVVPDWCHRSSVEQATAGYYVLQVKARRSVLPQQLQRIQSWHGARLRCEQNHDSLELSSVGSNLSLGPSQGWEGPKDKKRLDLRGVKRKEKRKSLRRYTMAS